MTMFKLTATYEDAIVTVETNDAEIIILELLNRAEDEVPMLVVSNLTGEVLVSVNDGDENYICQEWAWMTLGWLMENMWGGSAS